MNTSTNVAKAKSWINKHPWWTVIIVLAVMGILSNIINGTSTDTTTATTPAATTPSVASTGPQTQTQAIAVIGNNAVKTDNVIEDFTYSDVQISSDLSEQIVGAPAGSKNAIVTFTIPDFTNRDTLSSDTSIISSKVMQGVFANDPKMDSVIVWFKDPNLVDRYGNTVKQVIVSQSIDRATFEKINWTGFDSSTLCSFLTQEANVTSNANDVCMIETIVK